MKLTLAWLKTHLDTDAPLATLVQALTMLGLEVDGVADRGAALAPFRIARIVSAEPHPNADKLRLCAVDTGTEQVQVVCGAPNARTGLVGVFAPSGSTIPRTGMVLKPSTIRGVASNGMMCSGFELGLSEDHDGIVELPEDAPVGAAFAAYAGLDDPVLDVKITPNRADCLGVRGIARDLAAAGFGTLKPLATTPVPSAFSSPIAVEIADRAACPLFAGRVVRGVRNGPSPRWLQERLTAIGLRPISALVDITNFMTFDLCRPLHVFDADRLAGRRLWVHPAAGGEVLPALNGREYTLEPGMTAISDASGVISLGGVIGGSATGCEADTTAVFIEAALFDPVRTAATGRALNIASDARYRFERGLDPAFVFDGLEIATLLVLDLCGGEASEPVAAGAVPAWRRSIRLRPERVETLGGVRVEAASIQRILEALGAEVRLVEAALEVAIPSWRGDIEGEADLVEEVLRVHGYDHIPAVSLPVEGVVPEPALDPAQRRAELVRRSLAARGLNEAVTYSFMSSRLLGAGGGTIFGGASPALTLVNPISAELDAMRPTILPNLLVAAKANADRNPADDAALFEVGPHYMDDTPEGQRLVAAGLRCGRTGPKLWRDPGRAVDAFDAKADAMAALEAAGAPLDNLQIAAEGPGWYHPGRVGAIRLGPKTVLANFGEIHPRLMSEMGLEGAAVAFEVYLDAVPLQRARAKGALKASTLQPVERDFAFVVDADLPAEQLLRAARGADRALIASVRLFDVYIGPGVPEGKKSLAVAVALQPSEATLTEVQLETFAKSLAAHVEKATGGVLRR